MGLSKEENLAVIDEQGESGAPVASLPCGPKKVTISKASDSSISESVAVKTRSLDAVRTRPDAPVASSKPKKSLSARVSKTKPATNVKEIREKHIEASKVEVIEKYQNRRKEDKKKRKAARAKARKQQELARDHRQGRVAKRTYKAEEEQRKKVQVKVRPASDKAKQIIAQLAEKEKSKTEKAANEDVTKVAIKSESANAESDDVKVTAKKKTEKKKSKFKAKFSPKALVDPDAKPASKAKATAEAKAVAEKKAEQKAEAASKSAKKKRTTTPEERKRRRRQRRELNRIIDEVLLDKTGNTTLQEALEDVVGYDISEAEQLLEREREKRRRIAELEKMLKAETPEQRARRLRFEQRQKLREMLYRDERSKLQKAVDTVRYYRFRHTQIWLEEKGVLLHTWHVAVPTMLLIAMVTVNMLFMPTSQVEAAPESFKVMCAACENVKEVDRAQFEKMTAAAASLVDFHKKYPNENPPESSCENCNIVHNELVMVTCIDTGHRFLVGQTASDRLPYDPRRVAGFCPYHAEEHEHEVEGSEKTEASDTKADDK